MTIESFQRAATRTARIADSLSRDFATELAAVLRDLERRLVPIVVQAADGSNTAIIRSAQANRTRNQIRDALEQAGFDDLAASAYGNDLDVLVDLVLAGRRLAELSADLTPTLERRIEALKALAGLDLSDEGDQAARALWQALTRGIFGARDVPDILRDLHRVIDRREPQIRTLYDTSVSIFGRQVEALQAGDDPETPFLYAGPDDLKTREFCKAHVGKVFLRSEIDALNNGQLDNVFLTGGGYNCRHIWMEVSKYSQAYQERAA